ncbi:MAG: hypothetical protein IT381_14975 [Deltaproteobacteria bacterium]|nr:hypothetical protein [Deltaproteobacteria bacterium]
MAVPPVTAGSPPPAEAQGDSRAESDALIRQSISLGAEAERKLSAAIGKRAFDAVRSATIVDPSNVAAWRALGNAILAVDARFLRSAAISAVSGGKKDAFVRDIERAIRGVRQYDPSNTALVDRLSSALARTR